MIAFVEGGLQAGQISTMFVPEKSSHVVVASFALRRALLLDLAARLTTVSLDLVVCAIQLHMPADLCLTQNGTTAL